MALWIECHADVTRLRPPEPQRSADANALVLYTLADRPLAVRKYQLGDISLYEEGIDWCYGDDEEAVVAILAAKALT